MTISRKRIVHTTIMAFFGRYNRVPARNIVAAWGDELMTCTDAEINHAARSCSTGNDSGYMPTLDAFMGEVRRFRETKKLRQEAAPKAGEVPK